MHLIAQVCVCTCSVCINFHKVNKIQFIFFVCIYKKILYVKGDILVGYFEIGIFFSNCQFNSLQMICLHYVLAFNHEYPSQSI